MKKMIAGILLSAGALMSASNVSAVTLSGGGCDVWGPASYLFVNEGTSLAIVNGSVCFISGLTGDEASRLAAIVSQAQASGISVRIGTGASAGGGNANGLAVAMQ